MDSQETVVIVFQSLSCVQLFAIPWTAAHQTSLSLTVSRSLLKFMSIESGIPSNHLSFAALYSFCLQQEMLAIIRSLIYFTKTVGGNLLYVNRDVGPWAVPSLPQLRGFQCLWSLCVFSSRNWSQSIPRDAWCYSWRAQLSEPECIYVYQMAC